MVQIRLSGMALLLLAGCKAGISDVQVAENPNNVLSLYLEWTTAQPATTRVELGPDGTLDSYLEQEGLTTEHRILVLGMRQNTDYSLQAVSVTEDGQELRSDPLEVQTGTTPFADLNVEVTVLEPEAMQPGWTMSNLLVGDMYYPSTAVIFDQTGEPVWYYRGQDQASRPDIVLTMVDDERIVLGGALEKGSHALEMDLAGNQLWEGPEQVVDPNLLEVGMMHHEFIPVPDVGYLYLHMEEEGSDMYDVMEVIDQDLDTVWSWSALDHIPEAGDMYLWGNAALYFQDEGYAYYNSHNASSLYKIDTSDGHVVWALGDGQDFAPDPDARFPWVDFAHAPEFLEDGHVLFYDNGSLRGFSRVVEYELDQQNMTSLIAWQYPEQGGDDFWYDFHMGDANRLENGNTLIGAASLFTSDSQSRIFEVTPDGRKVWEMWLSGDDGTVAGFYRVQRVNALLQRL